MILSSPIACASLVLKTPSRSQGAHSPPPARRAGRDEVALGRPVVSTYVAGIPELVEPGRSGWLVPAGSIDALTKALREVLDTPAATLTIVAAEGRRRVQDEHDSRKNRILADLFARNSPEQLVDRQTATTC